MHNYGTSADVMWWCRRSVISGALIFSLFRPSAAQDSLADPAQSIVMSIMQKVETENRIVGNLGPDSLTSLPIGIQKEIGNTRYIIAIDSAIFLPDGAFFNAYMAIQFPGSQKKICFAARRIQFNPQGVIGGPQARLVLVSSHTISLSPSLKLRLPADGSNYIDWNCNGFEGVSLKGEFLFSKEKLIPDSTQTWEKQVKATFQCYLTDINDMIAEVNMTPFCLKGLKDWSFKISRAIVDMSSLRNTTGMVFPPQYPLCIPLWTGFYLEELSIRLPQHISRSGDRSEIQVRKVLIDDAGFSGEVLANDLFSLSNGNMDGWGFSIDQIGVKWVCNRLHGGRLSGEIQIPLMDSSASLRYNADISFNEQLKESDYHFIVSPANNIQFNAFRAKVNIYPTSFIEIVRDGGKLRPRAVLNGKIAFMDEKLKTGQLDFQQLKLVSVSPYILSGVFSFSSSGPSPTVSKYPVSISSIALILSPTQPKLKVDFVFNLMSSGNQVFSASTRLFITAKSEAESIVHQGPFPGMSTKVNWRFDKILIGGIMIETNTSPFYLNGIALFHENDPVYGDGFAGNLKFMIRNVTRDTAIATCIFGHTQFRYWYADVFVPVHIPLGAGAISITRLAGGLYHHMRPQKINPPEYIQTLGQTPVPGQCTQVYLPDENYSIGFKAGCTFKYTASERAANGDVMLEVLFTSSGGLHSVKLNGDLYMMCSVSERLSKPAAIKGTGQVLYDVEARVLDAQFSVQLKAGDQLSGTATAGFHIDPQTWYFAAGRPSAPASVSLGNIATANGYFMIGNVLEPMAPVPSQVSALVSNAGLMNLRNQELLSMGGGFCGGLRFSSAFYKEVGWDFFSVYGGFTFGAGFDLMLTHLNQNVHCGSISDPGMNGWIAQGQLYLYMSGGIGIKGHIAPNWCHADWCQGDFDITLFSGSLAAILMARGPNPSWFSGTVACTYSILGIVNGNLNFQFEAGNNCSLVGS